MASFIASLHYYYHKSLTSFGRDAIGGAVGALIAVPIILSCGVVIFHSLGPSYATAGISAAFVAAVVAAVVSALLGGAPLHINTPKTTHAAILSGLIAVVATHHSFTDIYGGVNAPSALMAICFLTLLVSGVVQIALGVSRMGALVKFVPYPVLAGFVNGFALQIILTQIPHVFGMEHLNELPRIMHGATHANWWSVGFALFSGGLALFTGKARKLVPAAVIGLVCGTFAQVTASLCIPSSDFGPVIGALPSGIPFALKMDDMIKFIGTHAFIRHAFDILATGVTLALVSSIQSLLSIASSERLFNVRHNSNRELMVQGVGNLLSAVFGGTPSGGSPNVTQAVFASGGRTWVANLAFALTLLGFSYGMSQVLALIPLSVMAGVVIVTTAGAMDKWTKHLLIGIGASGSAPSRRDLALNLAVVIIVAALVVSAGALAALGTGMAAVFMVFLYRSNAQMIRQVLNAAKVRSRTERSHAALDALVLHGHRIVILKLDGPLFFGSAETVARGVENELPNVDWVILDLHRVPHFDSSGVMMLKRLDELMQKNKKRLFLSHLPANGNRRLFLRAMGLTKPEAEGRLFEATDAALARAEDELLQKVGLIQEFTEEVSIEKFDTCHGMTQEEIHLLKNQLSPKSFHAGETILFEGARNRSLFFLTKGQVSILSTVNGQPPTRLASHHAGSVFGEMAMLFEQPCLAHIVADTPVILHVLTVEGLAKLDSNQPGFEAKFLRNLAAELSFRLLSLNKTVLELEA